MENNSEEDRDIEVFVRDVSGQTLKVQSHFLIEGDTHSIDLSDPPSGVYLIQLKNHSLLKTERIVKH